MLILISTTNNTVNPIAMNTTLPDSIEIALDEQSKAVQRISGQLPTLDFSGVIEDIKTLISNFESISKTMILIRRAYNISPDLLEQNNAKANNVNNLLEGLFCTAEACEIYKEIKSAKESIKGIKSQISLDVPHKESIKKIYLSVQISNKDFLAKRDTFTKNLDGAIYYKGNGSFIDSSTANKAISDLISLFEDYSQKHCGYDKLTDKISQAEIAIAELKNDYNGIRLAAHANLLNKPEITPQIFNLTVKK